MLSEPSSRLAERLHTQSSGTSERVDERHLHLESLAHIVPGERVFLSCLCISEGETRAVGECTEEIIHPFAVHSGVRIDRLERYYALPFVAQSVVILIYRVAAQHPEDGHRYLFFGCLGRHVCVESAGIVGLIPVSSPQSVAVCAYLVLAVARRFYAILVVHICQCVSVDEPRAHRFGVISEYLLELLHIDIHQTLSLFLGVACAESYVCVRHPRIFATPFQSRRLNLRLSELPPCAYLRTFFQLCLQQILVQRIDECVVFEQECCRKIVTVYQLHLPANRLVELTVGVFHAVVGLTYEVDDVYYSRLFVGRCLAFAACMCRACHDGKHQHEQYCPCLCHV